MGYQESMIEVGCLAEAAGIRKAVIEHEGSSWLSYYGTDRTIKDLRMGDPWGLPLEEGLEWWVRKGLAFVIVGGQRHPYQHCKGRWMFLDAAIDVQRSNYREFFEAVDEASIPKAWNDAPDVAARAYRVWDEYLDAVDGPEGKAAPEVLAEVIYGAQEMEAHLADAERLARSIPSDDIVF